MRYLCIDVEAVAIQDIDTYLVEPVEAPSNWKDPVKIEAYKREARQALVDKAALDVDLAQMAALGIRREDGSVDVLRCEDEKAERYALTHLWKLHQSGTTWVTFNGLGYDLPLVLRRSLYLGIPAPMILLDRFKHPNVIDVMAILSMDGKLKLHGLQFYANRFGLKTEPDITGAEIGAAVAAGDWAAVEKHCRQDVETTWALAQRIGVVPKAETVGAMEAWPR